MRVCETLGLGDANDAAGDTSASVTHWLRLQVVCFFVHDHAAANDRFLAAHRHHLIGQLEMRFAGRVGRQVAHVAFVTLRDVVAGVRIIGGIEMPTRGFAIGGRTVTEFMNVKSVLAGREAAYIRDDFYFSAQLSKGNCAFHLAALCRMEDGDGFAGLGGMRRGAGQSENGGRRET